MSKNAFDRYAPFIQEYIYRKGWTDIRQVQAEACDAILDTDRNIIIASGTASGKTEAAFFPMLTQLQQYPSQTIGILYISPLKALINNQFDRLTDLLDDADIPVWAWHGDISQSAKKKALQISRGILQITPESLEAMIMNHPGDANRLFSDIQFVVIDEIHAFMGTDRGLQVICLLSRLQKISGCNPRRIGLSATLNDYEPAMEFLSSGSTRACMTVGMQMHKRTVSLCAESFLIPDDEQAAQQVMESYYTFLYDNCHNTKSLIFTNSRADAELTISSMKKIASERGEPDVFYVHHGSVSAELRHKAEDALRSNSGPTVSAATLTLELGIDIGDLDLTIQTGAPYSCSSFVQRLGRSGRKTGKSAMLFVNSIEQNFKTPFDCLPWELLKTIAIIQLYIQERWVEPAIQKKKPFSLLAHQTLSILMSQGELSPKDLARSVLLLPAFNNVSAEEYKELLQYMLKQDYIQKLDNGNIIVGLNGEKVTNHFSFYAVFKDEETYHVLSSDGEVGTLNNCPTVDEVFMLAGRSWKVISLDETRKSIFVERYKAKKAPSWTGSGGDTHTKVVQRMREVLTETAVYSYLQPNAVDLLEKARSYVNQCGLLNETVIPTGKKSFYYCPFIGTKELRTIKSLLLNGLKEQLAIISVVQYNYYLHIVSKLDIKDFVRALHMIEIDIDSPDIVLADSQTPYVDKFDKMVPEKLRRIAYLHNEATVIDALNIMKHHCSLFNL